MSKGVPETLPRTLESFKKWAKKYARLNGMDHMKGLDALAKEFGYPSYYRITVMYDERTKLGDKTR